MSQGTSLPQLFNSVLSDIDDDLIGFEPLKKIGQKVNLKPSQIALGVIVFILLISFIDVIAHLAITIFGMIYPSYMTFKAINEKKEEEKSKWLSYWIVFSFSTCFDPLLNALFYFLPAYYTLKVIFYLWLFYPRTNGAEKVYLYVLKPYLLKFKQKFPQYMDKLKQK